MKGIILHGGHGTRLRPLTHTGPKQLLPIANKPMSQYALEDLKKVGITDIGIIIGDVYPEKVKEYYGDGSDFGVNISYIYQDEPKGISHAIKLCKEFIGNEKSSLITTLFIIIFIAFSFSRGFLAFHENVEIQQLASNFVLMPIFGSIFIISLIYIWRKELPSMLNQTFNLMSILIVAFFIFLCYTSPKFTLCSKRNKNKTIYIHQKTLQQVRAHRAWR